MRPTLINREEVHSSAPHDFHDLLVWTAALGLALWAALPVPVKAAGVDVRVGERFPALVLPSLADGSPLSVEQFRGRKVLLHQFASW